MRYNTFRSNEGKVWCILAHGVVILEAAHFNWKRIKMAAEVKRLFEVSL